MDGMPLVLRYYHDSNAVEAERTSVMGVVLFAAVVRFCL